MEKSIIEGTDMNRVTKKQRNINKMNPLKLNAFAF